MLGSARGQLWVLPVPSTHREVEQDGLEEVELWFNCPLSGVLGQGYVVPLPSVPQCLCWPGESGPTVPCHPPHCPGTGPVASAAPAACPAPGAASESPGWGGRSGSWLLAGWRPPGSCLCGSSGRPGPGWLTGCGP